MSELKSMVNLVNNAPLRVEPSSFNIETKRVDEAIFFCNDNTSFELNVKDDATPIESFNLCLMISVGFSTLGGGRDWAGYIEDKHLQRHFNITEK